MRSLPPPHVQRPIAEAMEPRVLYSADFAPAAFMASAASATDASHQRLIDTDTTTTANAQATPGTEIVFIDARVPDQAALLADLAAQAKAGRPIEVVLIDANEDGLARITQALADRHDVSAVHLISHGGSGSAHLGNTVLDESTLVTRAHDVASWGEALTPEADLLIYGCDVGAQANGQALVQGLAALTGADVAASDDLTGAALQGGDWLLEVQSGHIEALLAPSAQGQAAFSGVLAAVPTGKGEAVWANSNDSAAQHSFFDGATSATPTGTTTTGQWTWVTSASSPKRNETIAVGVTTTGTITGEVIQGGTSTLIPLTLGSGTPTNRQGFGVAYEQRSGDAMLVWNDGTTLKYSLYNDSTWTTAETVGAYTGAAPQHMQLVSQPGGDGMALIISDANADDHAMIWNGSSWGNAITLDTSGTSAADQTSIAVAFEAQSGHALVAYAKASDANVYFRTFDGSVWGTEAAAGTYLEAATPQWLTLASDPTSNRIAMGLISNSATQTFTSFSVWNQSGSPAWGNRTTVAAQNTTANAPTVAVAYESQSGDLVAVYGNASANTVHYRTLGGTGIWSAVQTGPNANGVVGALRLNSDPTTNNVMLGMQTTGGRLSFSDWTGSAWTTPVLASSNTGSSLTPAFSWTFQPHIAGNTTNSLWLGSNQANSTGWDGVNSVTSTEVLVLENPNLHYGSGTNTDGTFSHVLDMSAFGATGLDDIAWVSHDVVLSGSLTVHRGDLLFSVPSTTTLTSVNSLSASRNDVMLFRPTVAGDYSAGTFTKVFTVSNALLGLLTLSPTASIRGLALVEDTVTLGTTQVSAGTFLFSAGNGNTSANDILSFRVGGASVSTLIEGDDINLNSSITGLEVITSSTPSANAVLPAGTLLVSLAQADSQVANNYVNMTAADVVALTVYRTSGTNSAIAIGTMMLQGSAVGITTSIDSLALTLSTAPVIDSNGGGATASTNVMENTTAVTTVVAHDADPYADLTYSITGGADASHFTIDSRTGVLRFTSAPDYEKPKDSGKDNGYVLIVSASDGTYRNNQTLTVNVTTVNEAPVIVSGGGGSTANLVVADQTTIATTVQATDQDATDTLTYAIIGGTDSAFFQIDPSTGLLSFNSSVNVATPNDTDGDNLYHVTVRVTDLAGNWDDQTLNITVTTINTAPSMTGGNMASKDVPEFETLVTQVQASDQETPSQLSYGISGGADQTLFSIDAQTGELRFIAPPDSQAPGAQSSYTVEVSASDGQFASYQLLTVNILPYTRPVNQLPNDLSAAEDTPSALAGVRVIDPDAGSADITVTLTVQHGTLTVRDDVASGLDSTHILYDTDGRTVTLTGSVSAINATLADATGLMYLSDQDHHGQDNLTMTTVDAVHTGTAPPLTVTNTTAITVTAVNDRPTAIIGQSSYTATEQTDLALHNTGLRISDVDAAGGIMRLTLAVTDGVLTVSPGTTGVAITNSGTSSVILAGTLDQINQLLDGLDDGTVVYQNGSDTPPATATLTMTAHDMGNTGAGGGLFYSMVVTINITAVNDVPVAVGDSTLVDEDGVLNGSTVLGNDSDVEGAALTATLVSGTSHGVLVFNSNGSYTYTPTANFTGTDAFTYQANDGTDNSAVATVTITVNALNDEPVAVDDSTSVDEDSALNGNVLANDTDVDNATLTATLLSDPTHGTLVFNSNGSYTYTPTANFTGTDAFTYQANDGTDNSAVATVTITVNALNDAPVAVDDTTSVDEDSALNGNVLANATDVEGSALTATLVSGTSHGVLVFNSNGSYTYTPNANFTGTDAFTYQVNDGANNSTVATVTITVNALNDAPVAVGDSASVDEDTALNGNVLANATDVEGSTLTAALGTGPTHGTLVLNSNGSYTYTPTANFSGTDAFTYKVNDGTAESNIATVTITIAPVNDAPVITTNALTINQGGTAEPMLVLSDADNANTDLLISASDLVGGHFANASTGAVITQFTMAEVAAHQVLFVHDGSVQAPTYALSATDGQASASASTVQTSFTPTPPTPPPAISAPPPAPPTPPSPPDTNDSDSDEAEEAVTTGTGAATAAASAQAAAPIRQLSFFVDANNLAPSNAGIVVLPPANQYGVDLNNRAITASTVAASGEEAFRYSWLKALNTTLSDTQNLRNSLDALREQLQNDGVERRHLVASSIAVSTGLSVGYVIWLVRGGALIGSMLSAMPAWQMIDPLPVLARGRRGQHDDDDGGDDDVENFFDATRDRPAPPPQPAPPPPIIDEAAP